MSLLRTINLWCRLDVTRASFFLGCSPHRFLARRQQRKRFRCDAFPTLVCAPTPPISHTGSSVPIFRSHGWIRDNPSRLPQLRNSSDAPDALSTHTCGMLPSHTPVNKGHPTPMDACLSHWQLMQPMHPCSGVILTSSTCCRNHQAPSPSGARPHFGAALIHI